jgi:hypothetical protein
MPQALTQAAVVCIRAVTFSARSAAVTLKADRHQGAFALWSRHALCTAVFARGTPVQRTGPRLDRQACRRRLQFTHWISNFRRSSGTGSGRSRVYRAKMAS